MDKNSKNISAQILRVVIGQIICGIGIGFGIYAGLGVDPASMLHLGVSEILGISFGWGAAIVNAVIILFVFFTARRFLNIATALAIFLVGFSADYCGKALEFLMPAEINLPGRLLLVVAASIVTGIGIAVYISGNLGVGAVDIVSELASLRSGKPYRWVRVGCDVLFAAIGYTLAAAAGSGGKTFGWGTIILAVLTGPIIAFVRKFLK